VDGDRRGQAAAGGQNGKQALTEMVMAVGIRVCIGRRSCVRRVEARDALLYCECVRCPIAGGKDEVGAVAPGRKAGVRWACAPWGRALRLRPAHPRGLTSPLVSMARSNLPASLVRFLLTFRMSTRATTDHSDADARHSGDNANLSDSDST